MRLYFPCSGPLLKKCVNCQNDLPNSAVHCVFCGAKQPKPPFANPANNKTMMGYPGLAADLAKAKEGAGSQPGGDAPPSPYGETVPVEALRKNSQPPPSGAPIPNPASMATAPPSWQGPPPGRSPSQAPGPGGPPPGYGPPPGGPPPGYGGPPPGPGGPPPARPPGGPPPGYGQPPPPGYGPPPGGPGPGPGGYGPPASGGPPPPGGPGYGPRPGGPGPGPGGYGPPGGPGYGQTPPPGYGPGGPGGPPGYGPPPGGYGPAAPGMPGSPHGARRGGDFDPRPETELVRPLRHPYTPGAPGAATFEPWAESIKTLLLVYGVLLVACFVAPWAVGGGQTTFSWTLIGAPGAAAKLPPLLIVSTGVIAVVLGVVPLATAARGIACLVMGLAAVVVLSTVPSFDWRGLLGLIGASSLIGGLLLRSQYTMATLGRLLTTIGVVLLLALYLIPEGGQVPLVSMFKQLGAAPGKAKVAVIVGGLSGGLLPLLFLLVCLLVWLPGPGSAGAGILAWIAILYPVASALILLLVGGDIGATLKSSLSAVVYIPLATSAWLAFAGYGLASFSGKSLES